MFINRGRIIAKLACAYSVPSRQSLHTIVIVAGRYAIHAAKLQQQEQRLSHHDHMDQTSTSQARLIRQRIDECHVLLHIVNIAVHAGNYLATMKATTSCALVLFVLSGDTYMVAATG